MEFYKFYGEKVKIGSAESRPGVINFRHLQSVGVASFPHQEIADAKTLIECADKALYRAKEEGRNRVIVF